MKSLLQYVIGSDTKLNPSTRFVPTRHRGNKTDPRHIKDKFNQQAMKTGKVEYQASYVP